MTAALAPPKEIYVGGLDLDPKLASLHGKYAILGGKEVCQRPVWQKLIGDGDQVSTVIYLLRDDENAPIMQWLFSTSLDLPDFNSRRDSIVAKGVCDNVDAWPTELSKWRHWSYGPYGLCGDCLPMGGLRVSRAPADPSALEVCFWETWQTICQGLKVNQKSMCSLYFKQFFGDKIAKALSEERAKNSALRANVRMLTTGMLSALSSDIVLEVGQRSIPFDRASLCAEAPFFARMLSGEAPMKEASSSRIRLPASDPEVVTSLLFLLRCKGSEEAFEVLELGARCLVDLAAQASEWQCDDLVRKTLERVQVSAALHQSLALLKLHAHAENDTAKLWRPLFCATLSHFAAALPDSLDAILVHWIPLSVENPEIARQLLYLMKHNGSDEAFLTLQAGPQRFVDLAVQATDWHCADIAEGALSRVSVESIGQEPEVLKQILSRAHGYVSSASPASDKSLPKRWDALVARVGNQLAASINGELGSVCDLPPAQLKHVLGSSELDTGDDEGKVLVAVVALALRHDLADLGSLLRLVRFPLLRLTSMSAEAQAALRVALQHEPSLVHELLGNAIELQRGLKRERLDGEDAMQNQKRRRSGTRPSLTAADLGKVMAMSLGV